MSRGVSRPTLVHAPYAEFLGTRSRSGVPSVAFASYLQARLLLASPREGFTDDAASFALKGVDRGLPVEGGREVVWGRARTDESQTSMLAFIEQPPFTTYPTGH